MKKIRFLALMLTALMALAMLSGCGEDEEQATAKAENSSNKNSTANSYTELPSRLTAQK